MSCNCQKPDRTSLWTPIPDYRQPTEMLPGENMDCYAKRAGAPTKDVTTPKPDGKIDNTSVTSDLDGNVSETFKLTPDSTRSASSWEITIDGQPVSASNIPNLSVSGSTLSGKVADDKLGKSYKVMVKASDGDGEIDSKEYTLTPKKGTKDDTIKFVFPLPGGVVTCKFGPRKPPAVGASAMHKGIDCAMPGRAIGDIVSAADGTVVKCGPAKGFGNWVVIEHRDSKNRLVATSVYGHMNEWYVKTGQKVAAGQKIAKEGNAGIGSGAHLHFEIHKGAWGNPVDPLPYLNGTFETGDGNESATVPPSTVPTTNSNKGMTTTETEASAATECPDELPNQYGSPGQPGAPASGPTGQGSDQSSTEPPDIPISTVPSKAEVQASIQKALDEDPSLTAEDKKQLMFMAKIESGFKADAKNPTSSARGVYQMLDKTAVKYYGVVGIPATEANRNDPYKATKAQIAFYKNEQKKYYNEYKSSGTIAGKRLSPDVSARYANLTIGEFTYGLIHHDGVGNAVKGKDLQGVDYYRKKVREA